MKRNQAIDGSTAIASNFLKYWRAIATSWPSVGWSAATGIDDDPAMAPWWLAHQSRNSVRRQAGTGQQHFVGAGERGGDVSKEDGVVGGLALVLVMAARLDALGLHMFAVEHHDMGFAMVHPDDGVECAQRAIPSGHENRSANGL